MSLPQSTRDVAVDDGTGENKKSETSRDEDMEEERTTFVKDDAYLDTCYEWPRKQSKLIQSKQGAGQKERQCCCCKMRTGHRHSIGIVPDRVDSVFQELWDTESPEFLDAVTCECLIKVTTVDPKASSYELRMKCKWAFRTLDTHDKMETKMRVPGIRLPGLLVEVNESRVWKDLEKTKASDHTVFWRGVSLFTVTGFERFEMHDFPYDRQLMMMELFEFVWRTDKDSRDFVFSMHISSLRVKCVSMLPEWDMYPAVVTPLNRSRNHKFSLEQSPDEGEPPMYASRFSVMLRAQRCNWFYIVQIFGLTILITLASLMPLLLPAGITYIGNRLGLYSGGILTLTATKYSISDQLPSVPYSTKFDRVMFLQFFCVFLCAIEAVVVFRCVNEANMNSVVLVRNFETVFFAILAFLWIGTWLHLGANHLGLPWGYQPRSWQFILSHQEDEGQADESEMFETRQKHSDNQEKLAKLNEEISEELGRQGSPSKALTQRREALENVIAKSVEKRKAALATKTVDSAMD